MILYRRISIVRLVIITFMAHFAAGQESYDLGQKHLVEPFIITTNNICNPESDSFRVGDHTSCGIGCPNADLYAGKIRIFNEYVDMTCAGSHGSPYVSDNTGYSSTSLQPM